MKIFKVIASIGLTCLITNNSLTSSDSSSVDPREFREIGRATSNMDRVTQFRVTRLHNDHRARDIRHVFQRIKSISGIAKNDIWVNRSRTDSS